MYKGCASPLTIDWPRISRYDKFSMSVIPDVDPVDTSCIQQEHASIALCRLVSQDPGMNIISYFVILTQFGCPLIIAKMTDYTVFNFIDC